MLIWVLPNSAQNDHPYLEVFFNAYLLILRL
jgi:hypothetical protein